MMTDYVKTGKCRGGPWDGQLLAHWSFSKKLYELSMNPESFPVVAIEIGEYRLNDFGEWCWWETDAGRAYRKLHGDRTTHDDN